MAKVKQSDISFNEDAYKEMRTVQNLKGDPIDVYDYKDEFRTHNGKCKIKAAKAFDCQIDTLQDCLKELSGKKIDGFLINDLIGRYGLMDGVQKNRAQLGEKYGRDIVAVEFATEKLKEIIHSGDVSKGYEDYLSGIKKETTKALEEDNKGV